MNALQFLIENFDISLILCAVIGLLVIYYYNAVRRPYLYPPGPPIYPVFGNSKQLLKESRELGGHHLVLSKWCKEFKSPILGLRLGRQNFIYLETYELVREVFSREEFDGRSDNFFIRMRTMGNRMGVTFVDGPFWAEQRSFVARQLREVGFGRKQMDLEIEKELEDIMEYLENNGGRNPIWPGEIFSKNVMNVLWYFVAGHRVSRDDEKLIKLVNLLKERITVFDISGGILSHVPALRFIAPNWTGYNLIKRFNERLLAFCMELIDNHFENYDEDKANDDLIYAFISEINKAAGDPDSTFTAKQLTTVMVDIFIAGSTTTSTVLDLAFMKLVLRPDLEEKIYNEISQFESPSIAHRPRLPFTEAYLMEIQRYFHIASLAGPRRVTQDTILRGYRIPKNTSVLIGMHDVHMDKKHWGDPEIFRPERFLNESGTGITNTERLMPFAQGKRRCLGESLARSCLFIFFVGVVNKFTVKLPKDGSPEPDLKLRFGSTLSPKPYKILFEKRKP